MGNTQITTEEIKEYKNKLNEVYQFLTAVNPLTIHFDREIKNAEAVIADKEMRDSIKKSCENFLNKK
jgi:hypothetical protein